LVFSFVFYLLGSQLPAKTIPSPADFNGFFIQLEKMGLGQQIRDFFGQLPDPGFTEALQVVSNEFGRFVPRTIGYITNRWLRLSRF